MHFTQPSRVSTGSETHDQNKGWKLACCALYGQKQLEIDNVIFKLELYVMEIQLWKHYQTIPDKIAQILIGQPHLWPR